eukprot:503057_1
MLSFPKFISIVSVVIGCCFGWIDCDQNRMYWLIPEISAGATWCADEGRLCKGPGKVYYGQLTNWITKDIGDESIPCSNEYFGCDPLIGPKRCYIVKAPTPPPTRRPNYLFGFVQDKTCESYGMNSIYDSIQCQAAAMIIAEEYGLKTDTQFISQTDWVGSDRPTGCSYHQFGNIEQWGEGTTGDCNVNGYGGCFCVKGPDCRLPILGNDHKWWSMDRIGRYFAIDLDKTDCILGSDLVDGSVRNVRYSGTDEIRSVKLWRTDNVNAEGATNYGHGRKDNSASDGDWQIGEWITFEGVPCNTECI